MDKVCLVFLYVVPAVFVLTYEYMEAKRFGFFSYKHVVRTLFVAVIPAINAIMAVFQLSEAIDRSQRMNRLHKFKWD